MMKTNDTRVAAFAAVGVQSHKEAIAKKDQFYGDALIFWDAYTKELKCHEGFLIRATIVEESNHAN